MAWEGSSACKIVASGWEGDVVTSVDLHCSFGAAACITGVALGLWRVGEVGLCSRFSGIALGGGDVGGVLVGGLIGSAVASLWSL